MSPRPYFDDCGNPCLEQSAIVVADILGYSEKIQDAFQNRDQQSLLMRINSALGKARANLPQKDNALTFVKFFSDNLIIGYPFQPDSGEGAFELPQACLNIGHFQREMAVDGLFIRGGIAIDSIHISENLIFGKVLEELNNAEGRANYPRIVLLDSAIDYLETHPDIGNNSLLDDILWEDDCDGARFVNYLYPLGVRSDDQRVTAVQNHKGHIESNLETYRLNGKVLQKYNWLAKYHNRFCQESGIYNSESYKVEI